MPAPSSARCATSAASRGGACSVTSDRTPWRFSIAMVGLVLSSLIGLAFPLVIAGITTSVVTGGDPSGLDRLVVILLGLFVIQAIGSFLQTYLLGRRRRTGRGAAPGRPVRPARDAVARLPRRPPGRRARVAPVERRDAGPDDAHPDRHEPAVGGHRPGRLGDHPVHAQPDTAVHRPAPGAGPDRGGDRVRAAAPAGQHGGPGHDRPEHDDRRGGAVGHPGGQELRPRGLGARALRHGPPERRRDRLATRPVASVVRRADGSARVRGVGRSALVHRPPGHRRASSGSAR